MKIAGLLLFSLLVGFIYAARRVVVFIQQLKNPRPAVKSVLPIVEDTDTLSVRYPKVDQKFAQDSIEKSISDLFGDPRLAALGFGQELTFLSKCSVNSLSGLYDNKINIIIKTRDGRASLQGYEFIQTILTHGFSFNEELKIFDYVDYYTDVPCRLFSLCTTIEPGFFDLSQIGEWRFASMRFVLEYPAPATANITHQDIITDFELMYETALAIAKDLNAILVGLNDENSSITDHEIKYLRHQVKTLALNQQKNSVVPENA